jgi:hypothetical protein
MRVLTKDGPAQQQTRRGRLLVAGLMCGAAALAGCNKPANAPPPPLAALPPTTTAPPLQMAPADDRLPPAPAPRLLNVAYPGDAYAFADRAYAMDAAFADAPPDYDFDYDGASPWVWVANDGSECVAELTPDGWRYYYYDPGDAEPFFIADPDYDYGFENGGLVAVYGRDGRVQPLAADPARVALAGQFLARATRLRAGAAHDPHRAVSAADWAAHRDVITGQRHAFSQAAAANPAFAAFHSQHAAQDARHWNGEQLRREAWAARVDASMGDPGRAQAEWRAAASQSARLATAAGAHGPTWPGWRASPPPVGAAGAHGGAPPTALVARNETRSPVQSHLSGEARPSAGAIGPERSGGHEPGRFAANASPHAATLAQTAAQPREHLAAESRGQPHVARAASADNFGAEASARAPEGRPHHAVSTPHAFSAPHASAPHYPAAAHRSAQRVQAAPHFQASPHVQTGPHFQGAQHAAPHPPPAQHAAHAAPAQGNPQRRHGR